MGKTLVLVLTALGVGRSSTAGRAAFCDAEPSPTTCTISAKYSNLK